MTLVVLLGHQWRRHRVALVALAAGMFLFEWVMTRVAPVTDQADLVREIIGSLPPAMVALVGEDMLANLTPRGLMGFGYVHPFALLMLSVWVVRAGAGGLAGEVGRGTMDLIAARPVTRRQLAGAVLAALVIGLSVITGAAWLGTVAGVAGRRFAGLSAREFLPVACMAWLLFVALGSVVLALSARARAAGTATGAAAAVIATSFVLDYLARVWEPVRRAAPLSLFRYFRPQDVLASGVRADDVAVLVGVTVVAAVAAGVFFHRRDL